MTDNEIIEVLEWHIKAESCVECEAFENGCDEIILTEKVLDLINRQKSENERLQKLLDDKCDRCIERDRKEAYKEFAEKLKRKSLTKWDYHEAVDIEDIETLLKEMVGE